MIASPPIQITCPDCATKYRFPLPESAMDNPEFQMRFKCSVCSLRFNIRPLDFFLDDSSELAKNLIRVQGEDELRLAKNWNVVRDWIAQGDVSPTDTISVMGGEWIPITQQEDIAELFDLPPEEEVSPIPPTEEEIEEELESAIESEDLLSEDDDVSVEEESIKEPDSATPEESSEDVSSQADADSEAELDVPEENQSDPADIPEDEAKAEAPPADADPQQQSTDEPEDAAPQPVAPEEPIDSSEASAEDDSESSAQPNDTTSQPDQPPPANVAESAPSEEGQPAAEESTDEPNQEVSTSEEQSPAVDLGLSDDLDQSLAPDIQDTKPEEDELGFLFENDSSVASEADSDPFAFIFGDKDDDGDGNFDLAVVDNDTPRVENSDLEPTEPENTATQFIDASTIFGEELDANTLPDTVEQEGLHFSAEADEFEGEYPLSLDAEEAGELDLAVSDDSLQADSEAIDSILQSLVSEVTENKVSIVDGMIQDEDDESSEEEEDLAVGLVEPALSDGMDDISDFQKKRVSKQMIILSFMVSLAAALLIYAFFFANKPEWEIYPWTTGEVTTSNERPRQPKKSKVSKTLAKESTGEKSAKTPPETTSKSESVAAQPSTEEVPLEPSFPEEGTVEDDNQLDNSEGTADKETQTEGPSESGEKPSADETLEPVVEEPAEPEKSVTEESNEPIVSEEVVTEPVEEIATSVAEDFNIVEYEEIKVPENPVKLSRQGWISLNNEEIAKSVDLFAMALRGDPSNVEALYGMGYALEKSSEILAGYQRGEEYIEKKEQAIHHYCKLLGVSEVPPDIRAQVGGRLQLLNADCIL